MLRKADQEFVESRQQQVAKLDKGVGSMQDASRQIDRIEEDTIADQHRRSNQIDQISYFWSGHEDASYMAQSLDNYFSAMKQVRSRAALARDDLKTEMSQLNRRKEMFTEDIDHIQKTRQVTDEDSSDG